MEFLQEQIQDKGLYEGYIEALPFNLNVLAVAYGQVFNIEAYQRRLKFLTCAKTKVTFIQFSYFL
jgi:hypothetical protein